MSSEGDLTFPFFFKSHFPRCKNILQNSLQAGCQECLFKVNDEEVEGVYVHAFDDRDVTWFSPKWGCGATSSDHSYFYTNGGDGFLLKVDSTHVLNGAWCDSGKTPWNFICEANNIEMRLN